MICGWLGAEVLGRYLGNFPIETSRGKSSQSFCTISAKCSLFLWSRNISFENIFKNSMALSFSSTPGGSTGWWRSERDAGIQPSTAFPRTHRKEDPRICRQPAGGPFWAICRYFREIVLFQWGKATHTQKHAHYLFPDPLQTTSLFSPVILPKCKLYHNAHNASVSISEAIFSRSLKARLTTAILWLLF